MTKKILIIMAVCIFVLPSLTFADWWPPSKWGSPYTLTGAPPPTPSASNDTLTGATTPFTPPASNIIYQSSSGIAGLFSWFGVMLGTVLPVIIVLAVFWFVYNVFRYTISGVEDEKAKAKTDIVWGIVGIFVMVSVWGLVNILQSTFNLNNTMIKAPIIKIK